MNKVLYSRFNGHRKREYSLSTIFLETDGYRFVRKSALHQDALPFVAAFKDKFESLSVASLPCSVAPVKISGDSAEFPYVQGETLHALWTDALRRSAREELLELARSFQALIEKLPRGSAANLSGFEQIFGEPPHGWEELLFPGIVDLNLDNLVINHEGKVTLIDYEWVFPFPVPLRFVLFRAAVGWYGNVFGMEPERVMTLRELFALLQISEEDIHQFSSWESSFQEHVLGRKSQFRWHVNQLCSPERRDTMRFREQFFGDIVLMEMRKRVNILEQESLAKQLWVEEVERLLKVRDEKIQRLMAERFAPLEPKAANSDFAVSQPEPWRRAEASSDKEDVR